MTDLLLSAIRDAVRAEFVGALVELREEIAALRPMMTKEEARKYLRVSDSQIGKLVKRGLPVHYAGDGSPRFIKEELDEWTRNKN